MMPSLLGTTLEYWRTLWWYVRGKSFTACPYLREPENRQARVQLCALSLNLRLWEQPHYRHPSFAHDLRANLRNVAVPGTGVPLSAFCGAKPIFYLLILVVNPFLCLMGALNVARKTRAGGWASFFHTLRAAYRSHLLFPDDWFSYWRLNCALASWYWLVTREAGYALENKWTFLQRCMAAGVPCSPCDTKVKGLCIKHKNEEGGLGIHFFKNATQGGDWIIQETMTNDAAVARFLPPDAPLSTFRVMTGSRLGIASTGSAGRSASGTGNGTSTSDGRKGAKSATSATSTTGTGTGASGSGGGGGGSGDVFAFSCVFRAGRAKGLTDHDSVLFDVDVPGKRMGVGTSNMHWYQLGAQAPLKTPWLNHVRYTHHPDGHVPVTGQPLPEIDSMVRVCVEAHRTLFPGVPVAGWDLCVVADQHPRLCLLEVNLMCNFFKGSFDKDKYFRFMEDYFTFLDGHQD